MKHAKMITFLLMSFASTHSLISMESEDGIALKPIYKRNPQEQTLPIAGTIDTADTAIKQNVVRTAAFLGMGTKPLTEKECFNVVNMAKKYCGEKITDEEIKDLSDKNSLFKEANDYFCELAKRNIDNVTENTLEQISDVAACQPTAQLNWLPFAIKKYVMSEAYDDQRVYSYDVVFKGHSDTVRTVDMHAQADLAASASDDGTFRLWQLATGKQLHCFSKKADDGWVRFSKDGSQIATATVCRHQPLEIDIDIWDIGSKKILHTIKRSSLVTSIAFGEVESHKALTILGERDFSLYKLIDNKVPVCVASWDIDAIISTRYQQACLGNYEEPRYKSCDMTTWYATNKSRNLYLYKRMLLNKSTQFPTIQHIGLDKKLNEREKEIAGEMFQQRMHGTLR